MVYNLILFTKLKKPFCFMFCEKNKNYSKMIVGIETWITSEEDTLPQRNIFTVVNHRTCSSAIGHKMSLITRVETQSLTMLA